MATKRSPKSPFRRPDGHPFDPNQAPNAPKPPGTPPDIIEKPTPPDIRRRRPPSKRSSRSFGV